MKILTMLFVLLFLAGIAFAGGPFLRKKEDGRIRIEYSPENALLFFGECYKNPISLIKQENGDWQMLWETDTDGCAKLLKKREAA